MRRQMKGNAFRAVRLDPETNSLLHEAAKQLDISRAPIFHMAAKRGAKAVLLDAALSGGAGGEPSSGAAVSSAVISLPEFVDELEGSLIRPMSRA